MRVIAVFVCVLIWIVTNAICNAMDGGNHETD